MVGDVGEGEGFPEELTLELVIAYIGPYLAAEDPIRPAGVHQDHRQQEKRTDSQKHLRTG